MSRAINPRKTHLFSPTYKGYCITPSIVGGFNPSKLIISRNRATNNTSNHHLVIFVPPPWSIIYSRYVFAVWRWPPEPRNPIGSASCASTHGQGLAILMTLEQTMVGLGQGGCMARFEMFIWGTSSIEVKSWIWSKKQQKLAQKFNIDTKKWTAFEARVTFPFQPIILGIDFKVPAR